jgi:hypothetical protein
MGILDLKSTSRPMEASLKCPTHGYLGSLLSYEAVVAPDVLRPLVLENVIIALVGVAPERPG